MSRKEPLLLPAVCFAGGILISPQLDLPSFHFYLAVTMALLAVFVTRFRRYYILLLALLAGVGTERVFRPGAEPELDASPSEPVVITGCVVDPPAFSEGKAQFVLELEPGARVRISKFFSDDEEPPDLHYGQKIEIDVRVRKPRNFGNPGAFDFAGYLARRNIYWTATAGAGVQPKVLDGRCGSRVLSAIYHLRTSAVQRIEQLYEGNAYYIGILEALLIGDSAKLERVWADSFRRTGTYHALVVSGLHVTMIAMVLTLFLRLLGLRGTSGSLLAIFVVWLYAGICGWQSPVVRSAGGFTLFAIGRFYLRECRLLNLLAALAFLFLAFDPLQIWEASFQLTFLSVLALGALATPAVEATTAAYRKGLSDLSEEAKDMHLPSRVAQFRVELRLIAESFFWIFRLPVRAVIWPIRVLLWMVFWIWESMLVSGAVQLGLALPMVLFFHRMSMSGLSANLIVTPLLTFAVPTGLLAVMTGWKWPVAITATLLEWSRIVNEWHIHLEPNWRVPNPPLWLALTFVLSLIVLAAYRKRILLVPTFTALALILVSPFPAQRSEGELELSMIDVGQGDSLLVGFPDGKWMLVDGGGIPVFGKRNVRSRMDIGEDVVSPYLFTRSIRKVDIIASTHQHDDHSAGLIALMENFHPAELWVGATPESRQWIALKEEAAKLGVKVRQMHRGNAMQLGGVITEILSPPDGYEPKATPSNNDSLVMRLNFGDHNFLLTGDMERPMERAVLDSLKKTTVLKVAHHGSKTSSTDVFLDAAQPAIALISAGKDNMFRHPHPDVIARLREHGATIFRSDEFGLVTVRSNGKKLSIETHRWSESAKGLHQPF